MKFFLCMLDDLSASHAIRHIFLYERIIVSKSSEVEMMMMMQSNRYENDHKKIRRSLPYVCLF